MCVCVAPGVVSDPTTVSEQPLVLISHYRKGHWEAVRKLEFIPISSDQFWLYRDCATHRGEVGGVKRSCSLPLSTHRTMWIVREQQRHGEDIRVLELILQTTKRKHSISGGNAFDLTVK